LGNKSLQGRILGGNVGVVRYLDPNTNTIKEIAKYSRKDRVVNGLISKGGHGEERAWGTLVRRLGSEEAATKAVRSVFSELSPCPNCHKLFGAVASKMDSPLPFSYRFSLDFQYGNHIKRNKDVHGIW
jgi:hypothetical protein